MFELGYWVKRIAAPRAFDAVAQRWSVRCRIAAAVLLLPALSWAIFFLPREKYMGESIRILFIHVPCAWMSLWVLVWIAAWSAVGLIWHLKLAELLAMAAIPLGLLFTCATLLTGSIWGRSTWGTFWEWDPRLTSELLLLFVYLGIHGLHQAIEEPRRAARAAGFFALIGLSLLPVIHYSVVWWHSLHQGQTIHLFRPSPMYGLPIVAAVVAGHYCWFFAAVLSRARIAQLERMRSAHLAKHGVRSRQ